MKNTLIFDGAFGTYIASKKLEIEYPELANLFYREEVYKIHSEYIDAGSNAITTNTFAANRAFISDTELLDRIIDEGFSIAMEAAEKAGAEVFADIGPVNCERPEEEYLYVTEKFISLGAKNFLFETQYDAGGFLGAVRQIKQTVPGAIVIASFAVRNDGYTKSGRYYKELFENAITAGADYVGLNCVCGPAHILNLLRELPQGRFNLIAMPNAGYPAVVNERTVYVDNPEYFAGKLREIHELGVNAVGGCCGTTPEHIRRFTEMLGTKRETRSVRVRTVKKEASGVKEDFSRPFTAVELAAPLDTDVDYVLAAARSAKEAGADFVTIPDSPLGRTRANSIMISSLIQRKVGINAIPHLCCRDRNQIAIKGDLIAGNIDGVSRVLAITGDALPDAERGEAKNVFGLNSFKLIAFIKSLNEIIFQSDPYTICAALNINSTNFDAELRRAEEKIRNGAVCLFTQPIFSEKNLENYFKARELLKCKIAAGVMPIAGYKNALFLNNEVPGIEIPRELISRLEGKGPEETKEICVSYAAGIIDRLGPDCDGYYIMTPLKKIDYSAALAQYIKEKRQ
ncbi:MAG: bifunctional homocysteine S-methyltransferase/methylenetetrahydrofolate reductase [Oscillospiraceae bacterium]